VNGRVTSSGPGRKVWISGTRPACQPDTQVPLLSFVGWVDGSWVEGQAGVGKESDHQAVAFADSLDALFGGVGDVGERGGR
jgi:hypothetical protein